MVGRIRPKYLYGINLREYETVAEAANSRWSPPQAGIFSGHLEYAEWYAKWWALRMMDAVDKYNPDFIIQTVQTSNLSVALEQVLDTNVMPCNG